MWLKEKGGCTHKLLHLPLKNVAKSEWKRWNFKATSSFPTIRPKMPTLYNGNRVVDNDPAFDNSKVIWKSRDLFGPNASSANF